MLDFLIEYLYMYDLCASDKNYNYKSDYAWATKIILIIIILYHCYYKIIIIIIINYGMAYSNFTLMIIARESCVLVTPSH